MMPAPLRCICCGNPTDQQCAQCKTELCLACGTICPMCARMQRYLREQALLKKLSVMLQPEEMPELRF
jgi:hypothetical protein